MFKIYFAQGKPYPCSYLHYNSVNPPNRPAAPINPVLHKTLFCALILILELRCSIISYKQYFKEENPVKRCIAVAGIVF